MKGYCENPTCSNTKENGHQMHGAHILGVGAHPRISSDLRNGICLCSTCHRRSHDDYALMSRIVKSLKWYPKYEAALRENSRPGLSKVDWDERISFLKEIRRAIKDGDLTIEEARQYEL